MAIVGGGLCGAMVAYSLTEAGVGVAVLDKRDIGLGSTSSSTALVLYEIDMHLADLIALRGEEFGVRSYAACLGGVQRVRRLMDRISYVRERRVYQPKTSIYFAHNRDEAGRLWDEYETRRKYGFRVDYLTRDAIEATFDITRSAALKTGVAGQIDPYVAAHLLLDECRSRGASVF